uniref:THAP-type domain-containing protein n=1 Tax=Sander lucioperca TaxID=283035 RepID=A0A8C9YR28_SANLU
MPAICCAIGCNNSRKRNPELVFYSIPKEKDRRKKWLAVIRRDHWTPTLRPIASACKHVGYSLYNLSF